MKFTLPILALSISVLCAQIDPRGKQNPFMSTVSVLQTQVVTTVREVKMLRVIETSVDGTNTVSETNFVSLRTNTVSVTITNL